MIIRLMFTYHAKTFFFCFQQECAKKNYGGISISASFYLIQNTEGGVVEAAISLFN